MPRPSTEAARAHAPARNGRRRALLQDKVTHYSNRTQKMVSGTVRDARNRITGLHSKRDLMDHLYTFIAGLEAR